MQLLFSALLAALYIWSCEGGKECRPHVSAFLNCVHKGEFHTRGFEAPTSEKADAMVNACYERTDCFGKRFSSTRPPFPNWAKGRFKEAFERASASVKIDYALEKCLATMAGSAASEMEACMQSPEQGWTDFTFASEIVDSKLSYLPAYGSWLPQYFEPASSPVINIHNFEYQLKKAFSTGVSCSDSERQSLVSCLEGVAQKLYPTCENPLQTKIRNIEHKAGYCNRIEACAAEASLSRKCESELSELPDSLCKCAAQVADTEERGDREAKLLKCVEAELVPSFVMEHGRSMLRSSIRNAVNIPAANRFCPPGIVPYRNGGDVTDLPYGRHTWNGGYDIMSLIRGSCN